MKYIYPTLSPKIPLEDALAVIGLYLEIDPKLLIEYAEEDQLGGFHLDKKFRTFPHGIWGVEGQIIYALIRATRPKHILEIGNCWKNSTLHIGDAVLANGVGKVTTFDLEVLLNVPEKYQSFMKSRRVDLREFNYQTRPLLDFVFEDSFHTEKLVAHVWREFATHARSGAIIVSHDSEHFIVGAGVHAGIKQVVDPGDYLSLAIDPSDCGLALWRKP
jgi:hypothetical protein